MIEAKKTTRGGWTRKQLEEWSVSWPPRKGWKAQVCAPDGFRCFAHDDERGKWITGELPAKMGMHANGKTMWFLCRECRDAREAGWKAKLITDELDEQARVRGSE